MAEGMRFPLILLAVHKYEVQQWLQIIEMSQKRTGHKQTAHPRILLLRTKNLSRGKPYYKYLYRCIYFSLFLIEQVTAVSLTIFPLNHALKDIPSSSDNQKEMLIEHGQPTITEKYATSTNMHATLLSALLFLFCKCTTFNNHLRYAHSRCTSLFLTRWYHLCTQKNFTCTAMYKVLLQSCLANPCARSILVDYDRVQAIKESWLDNWYLKQIAFLVNSIAHKSSK